MRHRRFSPRERSVLSRSESRQGPLACAKRGPPSPRARRKTSCVAVCRESPVHQYLLMQAPRSLAPDPRVPTADCLPASSPNSGLEGFPLPSMHVGTRTNMHIRTCPKPVGIMHNGTCPRTHTASPGESRSSGGTSLRVPPSGRHDADVVDSDGPWDSLRSAHSQRLMRPLVACLAQKSAAEGRTAPRLYEGCLILNRQSGGAAVWVVGEFNNTPGKVFVTLRRSESPPPNQQTAASQVAIVSPVDDRLGDSPTTSAPGQMSLILSCYDR